LNTRPHEAQLEDEKAQEGHVEEGTATRPTKGTKNGKSSQNGKEELRRAQKHQKLIKLKNCP
jgi:hypothetical protein